MDIRYTVVVATALFALAQALQAKENIMTRIFLTGFEPFGTAPVNPSAQLARALVHTAILDSELELFVEILPVAAQYAPAILERRLIELAPDYCIMLGLAEGRAAVSIERVAINLCDFRIPDNAGEQLSDTAIITGGPDAYFSTLPVRAMREASVLAGVPTELSLTAGAFLCNQIFYYARHFCETHGLSTQVGFIHLPATPELAAHADRPIPSMSLELMASGLQAMVGAIALEHVSSLSM
jgi:pyroglutamyl-peptidase